jgi:hypothetical protein
MYVSKNWCDRECKNLEFEGEVNKDLLSVLERDMNTDIHTRIRISRISETSVSDVHLSMVPCRISHGAVADHAFNLSPAPLVARRRP